MINSEKPKKTSIELDNAILDDLKRKQIDNAKKRAVAQKSDYETFKNMVSVAHLKPINNTKNKKDDVRGAIFHK